MSAFTRSTNKHSILPLPHTKVSQQDLLLSQIAPGSIDFVRSMALHGGSLKNPFEDTLQQIKHDVIRNIHGLNKPKRRKLFRENFESSKYLCNIIKREREAIEKYAVARNSPKKTGALDMDKDARGRAAVSVGPQDRNEWYDWVDSFARPTPVPERGNKTPFSRSPNKVLSQLDLSRSRLPTTNT